MVFTQQKRAIGVLSSHEATEESLKALNDSGFPLNKISIVAKNLEKADDTESDVEVSNRIGDVKVNTSDSVVNNTAAISATGFTILGLTSLALPGIGIVLAAGSLAAAMAATVASTGVAAAAANNIVKALTELGIPEEQAKVYSDRLQQGNALIMVEGSEDDIHQAEAILSDRKVAEWGIY